MEHLVVRRAELEDLSQGAEMCHCLWPEVGVAEHAEDLASLLAGKSPGALPAVVLLAQEPESRIVGFIEVGLRSHADGSLTFLEVNEC
ncbi:MAG: hypothetical protein ACR2IV_07870 [Bryobacteraceae bacterium]